MAVHYYFSDDRLLHHRFSMILRGLTCLQLTFTNQNVLRSVNDDVVALTIEYSDSDHPSFDTPQLRSPALRCVSPREAVQLQPQCNMLVILNHCTPDDATFNALMMLAVTKMVLFECIVTSGISPTVRALALVHCRNNINCLSASMLTNLTIVKCNDVQFIPALPHLVDVIVTDCDNFQGIYNIQQLQRLLVKNCAQFDIQDDFIDGRMISLTLAGSEGRLWETITKRLPRILERFPLLTSLILNECFNLTSVPRFIGKLRALHTLRLPPDSVVNYLPRSFVKLHRLSGQSINALPPFLSGGNAFNHTHPTLLSLRQYVLAHAPKPTDTWTPKNAENSDVFNILQRQSIVTVLHGLHRVYYGSGDHGDPGHLLDDMEDCLSVYGCWSSDEEFSDADDEDEEFSDADDVDEDEDIVDDANVVMPSAIAAAVPMFTEATADTFPKRAAAATTNAEKRKPLFNTSEINKQQRM